MTSAALARVRSPFDLSVMLHSMPYSGWLILPLSLFRVAERDG